MRNRFKTEITKVIINKTDGYLINTINALECAFKVFILGMILESDCK